MRKIISLMFILAIFAVMFGGGGESFAATVEPVSTDESVSEPEPVSTDEPVSEPEPVLIYEDYDCNDATESSTRAAAVNCANGTNCNIYQGTGFLGTGFLSRTYCLPCGQDYTNGFQCNVGYLNDGLPKSKNNQKCFCVLPYSLCRRTNTEGQCTAACEGQPCIDQSTDREKRWRTPFDQLSGCECI